MASGISFCVQESCGVLKTAAREPSSLPVIVRVVEAGWPSASWMLCACETAIRTKQHRTASVSLIVIFTLSTYLTLRPADPLGFHVTLCHGSRTTELFRAKRVDLSELGNSSRTRTLPPDGGLTHDLS